MANKMLIDATHPEETRVVVLRNGRVEAVGQHEELLATCEPYRRIFVRLEHDHGPRGDEGATGGPNGALGRQVA